MLLKVASCRRLRGRPVNTAHPLSCLARFHYGGSYQSGGIEVKEARGLNMLAAAHRCGRLMRRFASRHRQEAAARCAVLHLPRDQMRFQQRGAGARHVRRLPGRASASPMEDSRRRRAGQMPR